MLLSTPFKMFLARFKTLHCYHYLIAWLLGQLAGFLTGIKVEGCTISPIQPSGFIQTPVIYLVAFGSLPLCLSYFAMRSSKHKLLLLIIFLKAFAFTYCICCVAVVFGSAGWLLRWLVFFADSICSGVYLFFVLTAFDKREVQQRHQLIACIIIIVIFALVDHFIILPFCSTIY